MLVIELGDLKRLSEQTFRKFWCIACQIWLKCACADLGKLDLKCKIAHLKLNINITIRDRNRLFSEQNSQYKPQLEEVYSTNKIHITGLRCFHYTASKTWNSLPESVRSIDTLGSSRRHLKTFIHSNCHFVSSLNFFQRPLMACFMAYNMFNFLTYSGHDITFHISDHVIRVGSKPWIISTSFLPITRRNFSRRCNKIN